MSIVGPEASDLLVQGALRQRHPETPTKPPREWSLDDVQAWLVHKGYHKYAHAFASVDGPRFLKLTHADLADVVKDMPSFVQTGLLEQIAELNGGAV
jgi:hypothetical protein